MLYKNRRSIRKYFLVVILIVAFILRFWDVGKIPEAIDEDEMALGYYGYSLIHNGTDEYGNRFPIYFQSVGDYKYGLYSYFAALPIGILGLTTTSARLVAVLAGTASVVAIYFLSLEIFKSKNYALLSAFVLAISPTHIHFSRVAYNNVLGGMFAIFSVVFLLRCFKKEGMGFKNVVFTLVCLMFSIFSYQAYRIFLPLVFVLLFVIYFKDLRKRGEWRRAIVLVLVSVLIVVAALVPMKARARAYDLSTLSEEPKIIEQHTEDGNAGTSIFLARAFHNKISALAIGFLKRYLSYFDPRFLFVEASSNVERHTTPDFGLVYLIEAPLVVFGFLALISLINGKEKFIPLILFFSAPIAASLVLDSTSVTRSVIFVYAISLIIALGIYSICKQKKFGKYLFMGVFLLYFFNFLYFAHQYTVHKLYHHPWYGDVGLKEMVESVNSRSAGYSAIVVHAGHYMPFLFYNHPDPKVFIQESEFAIGGGVKRYGKIYFNMPDDCPLAGKKGVLYVCFGYRAPLGSKVVDVIYYRDGQPAIFLVEFVGSLEKEKLPERMEYMKLTDSRFPLGVLPDSYPSFWPEKEI